MAASKIALLKDDDPTYGPELMGKCARDLLSVCKFYELSPVSVANIVTDGYISLLSIRVIKDPRRVEEFGQCAENKGQSNLLEAMLEHIQSGVTFDDGSKKGKRTAAAADLPGQNSSVKKTSSKSKVKRADTASTSKVLVVDDDDDDDLVEEDDDAAEDVEKVETFGEDEVVAAQREELLEVCRANFGNRFSSHVIMKFKSLIKIIHPATRAERIKLDTFKRSYKLAKERSRKQLPTVSTAVYNLVNGTAESKSLRMFEKDLSGSVADGGDLENSSARVFPRYRGGFRRGAGSSGPSGLGRGYIPLSERTCHRCFMKGHLRADCTAPVPSTSKNA
jgi:hypothetical protein